MIMDTAADLEDSLQHINNRLRNISQLLFPTPKATELERLQEEVASIKQCLLICSHAASTADQYRTHIFHDTSIINDDTQIVVATAGDIISAKRITGGSRSIQLLGLLSEDSMKRLMQVYEEKKGLEMGVSQFEDLYGIGVKLNAQGSEDVDATSR
jgi:hypothetical protein